ncbi:MAG: glutathione peroxidase [Deltaproteobacteria bacterium]|nr:glutathione peroxidase [Deltaproteobacteria bacterium]|tara:strand:- start:1039 stop:1527 length:489 start_codon:yes stop_codon:yes gene_type:complete
MSIYEIPLQDINGQEAPLSAYKGKTLLLVNVASKCGLTPQYKGLQALYDEYKDKGLEVIAFPCNQFGAQEPGTHEEIKTFCSTQYNVTFPLYAKLDVNGPNRHPLYTHLTNQETTPDGPGDIKWNFAKFLINPEGDVVARFSPRTTPEDQTLLETLKAQLPK